MHSSGMCTDRLLTISQHALHMGVSAWGVLAQGCIPAGNGADTPPRGQTDIY